MTTSALAVSPRGVSAPGASNSRHFDLRHFGLGRRGRGRQERKSFGLRQLGDRSNRGFQTGPLRRRGRFDVPLEREHSFRRRGHQRGHVHAQPVWPLGAARHRRVVQRRHRGDLDQALVQRRSRQREIIGQRRRNRAHHQDLDGARPRHATAVRRRRQGRRLRLPEPSRERRRLVQRPVERVAVDARFHRRQAGNQRQRRDGRQATGLRLGLQPTQGRFEAAQVGLGHLVQQRHFGVSRARNGIACGDFIERCRFVTRNFIVRQHRHFGVGCARIGIACGNFIERFRFVIRNFIVLCRVIPSEYLVMPSGVFVLRGHDVRRRRRRGIRGDRWRGIDGDRWRVRLGQRWREIFEQVALRGVGIGVAARAKPIGLIARCFQRDVHGSILPCLVGRYSQPFFIRSHGLHVLRKPGSAVPLPRPRRQGAIPTGRRAALFRRYRCPWRARCRCCHCTNSRNSASRCSAVSVAAVLFFRNAVNSPLAVGASATVS